MLNIQTASLDILLQKVLGIQRAIIFGLIFTMCLSSFKFANAQESDTSLSGYLFTERTLDAAVKVRAHELEIDGVSVSTLDENGQTYTAYFGEGVNKNAVFQAASMGFVTLTGLAVSFPKRLH